MMINSIRARLQLWYGLILVAVLAGFGATAYQLERGRQMRRIDAELERRANLLATVLRPPPGVAGDRVKVCHRSHSVSHAKLSASRLTNVRPTWPHKYHPGRFNCRRR